MKKWLDKGYYRVYDPKHPNAYSNGTLYEHTWVMSNHLGRKLRPGENVHHRNGNKTDNSIENLELWVIPPHAGQRIGDLIKWAKDIRNLYPMEWVGTL